MKYRATVSFSGTIAMYEGEVRDLNKSLASEYVECGYLEEVKTTTTGRKKVGDKKETK